MRAAATYVLFLAHLIQVRIHDVSLEGLLLESPLACSSLRFVSIFFVSTIYRLLMPHVFLFISVVTSVTNIFDILRI